MPLELPTALLGRFASEWGRKMLPTAVADKAAMCLLDGIGLALIAENERTAVAVRAVMEPIADPTRSARVWVDGARVGLADAVLANAVAVHAQFHDDSENDSWTHPGSFIIPVATALGELADAPLGTMLNGIAVGYSATTWLGAKERVARALIDRGIRTSPTLGTIGAAASAAAMLDLDPTQATNAIGIASSITGGVLEPVGSGSDEWRLQVGHAARGGLLAAQLAQRGVLGSPQGLEGRKGLARALAGLDATPIEWTQAPAIEMILGVCAKPFATLGDNMSVVIAAKLLHDSGIDPRRIRKVSVKFWRHYAEYPGTAFNGPFERVVQALASTTFSAAAMLVYGELEYDKPQDHRLDPEILRLVPLVEIVPDDDGGPYDADVTVELDDGSRTTRSASESSRAQLFHDRPTAIELIEKRMAASGRRRGTGTMLAQAVFAAVDGKAALATREFLRLATART
ncbi:MAG: MmgE/PrpD family protein [Caldimonas sp.]